LTNTLDAETVLIFDMSDFQVFVSGVLGFLEFCTFLDISDILRKMFRFLIIGVSKT